MVSRNISAKIKIKTNISIKQIKITWNFRGRVLCLALSLLQCSSDVLGKTHCLFARFRSFAAYLRARQTKPPATQALDWPCTVHINSSSATFFSISPVIHNAS